jgi:hypothetical protein
MIARTIPITATLAIALLCADPRVAAAQQSSAALATELFYAGRDLMSAGNYAEGCPKLAQSARLDAKVGTFARLAECDEKLGQMATARAHWQQATNLARALRDERLSHVEAELARVDKLVPKVTISMVDPPPAGLSLRVDGNDVGAASLGVALPVDAGRHTISVSATGKKLYVTTVDTRADGATSTVVIPRLADAPVEVVPAAPSGSGAESPAPYWTMSREVAVVAGGAGAVALVLGVVFGVEAKAELDKSNGEGCSGSSCGAPSSNAFSDRTTAFHDGTIGTVLLIAGGVVAASGVTLFLLSPGSREAARPSAAVTAGPGWLGLGGKF